MGSGAFPQPGSPEIPAILTKEGGHRCLKSCWVKHRVSVGWWWLWRGRRRVGRRWQLRGWVCAGLGFRRTAGGEGSGDDAVALRLFPRPTQHFNQSGASASCKRDRRAEWLFPGLQPKLPQPGAGAAEVAPAALKLAAERRGTRCLLEFGGRGLLATSSPASPHPHHLSAARSGSVQPGLASPRHPMQRSSRGRANGERSEKPACRGDVFLGSKGGAGGNRGPGSAQGQAQHLCPPAHSRVRNFARGSGGGLRGARRAQEGEAMLHGSPGDQTTGGERSRAPRAGANFAALPLPCYPSAAAQGGGWRRRGKGYPARLPVKEK